MIRRLVTAISLVGLLLLPLGIGCEALAQEKVTESETELAKKVQNPVADLISIPLQNRTMFGIGPNHRTQNILNVQPVFAQDGAGPLPQQGTTDNRDAAGYGIRVAGYEIRDM